MSDEEEGFFLGGPEDLLKILQRLTRGVQRPSSNNPEDYPRAVKITDEPILGKIWRLEKLVDQLLEVKDKAKLLKSQHTALQMEIFMDLKAAYPGISPRRNVEGGEGWRAGKDEFLYYVGWDGEEPTSKEE